MRGQKMRFHYCLFIICELLIFKMYFTGAGCSYIYIAAPRTCKILQYTQLLFEGMIKHINRALFTYYL